MNINQTSMDIRWDGSFDGWDDVGNLACNGIVIVGLGCVDVFHSHLPRKKQELHRLWQSLHILSKRCITTRITVKKVALENSSGETAAAPWPADRRLRPVSTEPGGDGHSLSK